MNEEITEFDEMVASLEGGHMLKDASEELAAMQVRLMQLAREFQGAKFKGAITIKLELQAQYSNDGGRIAVIPTITTTQPQKPRQDTLLFFGREGSSRVAPRQTEMQYGDDIIPFKQEAKK